jgi:t-SNARE complex subunit (syntaxin)
MKKVNGYERNTKAVNGYDDITNGGNNQRENFMKQTRDERNIEEVNSYDENTEAVNNLRDTSKKEIFKADHFGGKRRDSSSGTVKQPTTKLFSDCVDD